MVVKDSPGFLDRIGWGRKALEESHYRFKRPPESSARIRIERCFGKIKFSGTMCARGHTGKAAAVRPMATDGVQ